MNVAAATAEFFVAGGTLRPDAPSYVTRSADDELLALTLAGEFCYVLTPRQMGKSSLMVRTAQRLHEEGARTAIIDLTSIGTDVTPDEWYLGIISRIAWQLRLEIDVQQWWQENSSLGVVQRFTDFLRDAVLVHAEVPTVIFVDEIDTTLRIPFSDDFFAAIRSTHNERARDPLFRHLTFVLLGVATPSDLMKDRTRTPFNVGHRLDLEDFNHSDAAVLRQGLEDVHPTAANLIFARIFYWTNGHPYLTQKLCQAVLECGMAEWSIEAVDDLVDRLFLTEAARRETNLQSIRDNLRALSSAQQRRALLLYRDVYGGRRVVEDKRSFAQNQLKLVGLLRGEHGRLHIRNEIYRRVFDRTWVDDNLPIDWERRFTVTFVLLVTVILFGAGAWIWLRNQDDAAATVAEQEVTFLESSDPTTRLRALGAIYARGDPAAIAKARELFTHLRFADQEDLFHNSVVQDVDAELRLVVLGATTMAPLERTDSGFELLLAVMGEALDESDDLENQAIATQIDGWLRCRESYRRRDFDRALLECDHAAYIRGMEDVGLNPALRYDLARSQIALHRYDGALQNLNSLLDPETYRNKEISETFVATAKWREQVQATLQEYPGLAAYWGRIQNRQQYPFLATLFPPATPGGQPATPPPTPTAPQRPVNPQAVP